MASSVVAEVGGCCLHFKLNKPETVIQLTTKTFETLNKFVALWSRIDKEPERSLCERSVITVNSVIHRSCYERITNKSKLDKAKRKEASEVM